MKIDRLFMTKFRTELDAAVAPLAAKYGLRELHTGSATFDPTSGNFHFKVEGVGAEGLTKEEAYYDSARRWNPGWPDRGTAFDLMGQRRRVFGCNTTASKIVIVADDGKKYLLKADAFSRRFPAPPDYYANRQVPAPGRAS